MSPMLRAGAARALINPPLGIKTVGFSTREGVVESIESDLSATALVLACDETKVAILALDLCIVPIPRMEEWRRNVAEAIGTTADRVMINISHSHSAAALPHCPPEFDYQLALTRAYQELVVERVVVAAVEADRALRPARIAAGRGESRIGINRREVGPDGLVFLGEVPDAPIDPAVGVVRVDDLEGEPIAILCSYGCHTVVVGPRSSAASPDFPGATREVLEKTIGGLALFLQGGGGDIMPVGGMGYETDCRDAKNRVGTMLGAEAAIVAAGLRTHVERGERTSLPSLLGSGMTLTPWVPVEGESCSYLGAISETVTLDLVPFPSLEVAREIKAERRQDLAEAKATGTERNVTVATRFAIWADTLVESVETGRPATSDFVVQAIRVNDIVLVGLSAEVFSGTTMTIRERSPFEQTVVLGYTNGVLSYLPRAQDYPPGGWDVRARYRIPDLVFQAYLLPTGLRPDSEERVVDKALDLIGRLAPA